MSEFIAGFALCWVALSVFTIVGEYRDWYKHDSFWLVIAFPILFPCLIIGVIRRFVIDIKNIWR